MHVELILGPVSGAVIGYFANRLAVRMIFRPHRAWYVAGFRVPFTPGMFVARRHEFGLAFARALVDRFCGPQDVIRVLGQALDGGLEDRLKQKMSPFVWGLVRNKLDRMSPQDITAMCSEVSEFIRTSGTVEKLVEANVELMSPGEVEAMVREICGRELRSMAYFDAAIGAAVGLVQALVTLSLKT